MSAMAYGARTGGVESRNQGKLHRRRLFFPWAVLLLCLACARENPDRDESTLRIYLARHGRTDWNAAGRLQGQSDTNLDATGREQAEQLAAFMHPIRLDAVYSSTLHRSMETAEIARGHAPLTSLDGLRERALGKFEGLRLRGGDSVLVAEFSRRSAVPDDDLDGGESVEQHFARVREVIREIRQSHPAGSILVVGHGGTNQLILRTLLNLTPEQADSIHQANDEVYLIELSGTSAPRLWKHVPIDRLEEL